MVDNNDDLWLSAFRCIIVNKLKVEGLTVREIKARKRKEKRSAVIARLQEGEQIGLKGNNFVKEELIKAREEKGKILFKLEGGAEITLTVIKTSETRCGLCLEARDPSSHDIYEISCLHFGERSSKGKIKKVKKV